MQNTRRYIGTHPFDITIERCTRCGATRSACDDKPKCAGRPAPDNGKALFADDDDD
jgi:hypothetical protein